MFYKGKKIFFMKAECQTQHKLNVVFWKTFWNLLKNIFESYLSVRFRLKVGVFNKLYIANAIFS